MKKYLLLLLIALGTTAAAQQRFDAELFAGLNMAQIDGDGAGRYNHPGLRAGIGTSFALGSDEASPWRGVVQLAYTQKGSAVEDIQRSINLDYVELTAMLSYNFLDSRARIGLGLAPAVLVRAAVTDYGTSNQALADNFRRTDLLPLVLQVRYLATPHIGLEVCYTNAMLSNSKEATQGTYRIFRDNKGTFSRTVAVGLTYKF